MKKTILMTMVLVLVFSQVSLGLFVYGEVNFYDGSSVSRADFIYEDGTPNIAFRSGDEFMVPTLTMVEAIETYYEWRETATENEVVTTRKISDNDKPVYFYSYDLHGGISRVEYGMHSEAFDDHRFYIYIDEVESVTNQYISGEMDNKITFTYEQTQDLEYRISEQGIEEAEEAQAAQTEQEEEMDELFD